MKSALTLFAIVIAVAAWSCRKSVGGGTGGVGSALEFSSGGNGTGGDIYVQWPDPPGVDCLDEGSKFVPGETCMTCAQLEAATGSTKVACNYGPSFDGGPDRHFYCGVTDGGNDCRSVGCQCHACTYNWPSACGNSTCGGGCSHSTDCRQPVEDFSNFGVAGLGCYAGQCYFRPQDGGPCHGHSESP